MHLTANPGETLSLEPGYTPAAAAQDFHFDQMNSLQGDGVKTPDGRRPCVFCKTPKLCGRNETSRPSACSRTCWPCRTPNTFPGGFRFWYLLGCRSKRAEQGPCRWRCNAQGADWVRALITTEVSLSRKAKAAVWIFIVPCFQRGPADASVLRGLKKKLKDSWTGEGTVEAACE